MRLPYFNLLLGDNSHIKYKKSHRLQCREDGLQYMHHWFLVEYIKTLFKCSGVSGFSCVNLLLSGPVRAEKGSLGVCYVYVMVASRLLFCSSFRLLLLRPFRASRLWGFPRRQFSLSSSHAAAIASSWQVWFCNGYWLLCWLLFSLLMTVFLWLFSCRIWPLVMRST